MQDNHTSAIFAPHLHETFYLAPGPWGQPHDPAAHGDVLAIELIEVTDLAIALPADAAWRGQFSLVFRAAGRAGLPQRTYSISHAALGQIDLFLVPIGPDEIGMRYQAVFT